MKRLAYLLFVLTTSLYSLQPQRVILATDTHPSYLQFWPLTARIWEEVVGVRPTLALIAPDDVEIDESLGDVIRFRPIPGIPTSFQAQVIRLLLPSLFPEDTCLISDIDLFPMQKAYFVESLKPCDEDSFVVFRDEEYSRYDMPLYPMCYLAGKGKVFQQLFELSSAEEIPQKIQGWYALNWGWSTDEQVVYHQVQKKKEEMPIRFLGHLVTGRIDRGDWDYDPEILSHQGYIDAHLPRPYEQNKVMILQLLYDLNLNCLNHIFTEKLPEKCIAWQIKDENQEIMPWFTPGFLEQLKTWDMTNWTILECGGGASTLWLANRCKKLVTIEDHPVWASRIQNSLLEKGIDHVDLRLRTSQTYVRAIDEDDTLYDCIIVDGSFRNEIIFRALDHIKPGGILILDNANQASSWVDSSPSLQLLSPYPHFSFPTADHPDWKTDYWIIDASALQEEEFPSIQKEKKNRPLPESAFGTHSTPLLTAVLHTKGPILEMGCGDYSTPLLHAICEQESRFLLSADSDKEWLGYFDDLKRRWHAFQYVPCYENQEWATAQLWSHVGKEMPRWGVVFIDHRPGERRVVDIERMRHQADIIVVHDTECPSYHYEPTLSSFKYRYDYERYTPRTTLVSETIDVTKLFR